MLKVEVFFLVILVCWLKVEARFLGAALGKSFVVSLFFVLFLFCL